VDALAGRAVSRCAASRDYTAAACADSPGVLLLVGSAGGGGGGGGGGGAAADAPPPGVRRVALPVPPEEAAARRAAGDAGDVVDLAATRARVWAVDGAGQRPAGRSRGGRVS